MRVLLWSEMFWPYIGGAEVWAAKLLLALRQRGHEFIVVTRQDDLDHPRETRFKGIPVYRFPFHQGLAGSSIDKLMEVRQQVIKLKRTFAPDLVHISFFGPSTLFHLDTARAHAAPSLITLHGDRHHPPRDRRDTLLEQTLRATDWVTAPSAAIVEYARHLIPDFVLQSSVIYHGLEVPLLSPAPLPFDAPRLLCLGRLDRVKGFDVALTTFASIVARFPKAHLMIAGDGPERLELERQAAGLGLGDAIEFIGWVAPDTVPALMNTATVVVMPSRREGFGLVALQAALMARPVVATQVGGLPEVVVHQQTGLLVEPEDSGALAEAIAFLFDRPETATRMGVAARQRAQEVFSWELCVNAYDALYRRLVVNWRRRYG